MRLKITPRNIYTNFLPIKAVSGSSFTLINSQELFGINYNIFLITPIKLQKKVIYLWTGILNELKHYLISATICWEIVLKSLFDPYLSLIYFWEM